MPQSNPPRVVLIHNFLPPHRVPLFEELATRFDLDVWILGAIKSVREWDEPESSAVRIRSLPRITLPLGSRYNALLLNYTLRRELDAARPDALICCGWDSPAAFQCARWARRTRTPFIVWSGSTPQEDTLLRRLTKPLVRWYVESASAWLAYGTRANAYLAELGADEARIFCAFNTVDIDYYLNRPAPSHDAARALRQQFGMGEEEILLYVGNLLELKGVYDLLHAFRRFAETRTDVSLVLIGEGRERASLQRLAAEWGIGDRVVFTGFADRETVAAAYSLANLLVLPSHSEVWGLVINEALASGLPVLATDVCGAVADLIEDGVNGYIVPSGDVAALTGAMRRHFDAPELHDAIRASAREHIAPFTFSAAADAFEQAVAAARAAN